MDEVWRFENSVNCSVPKAFICIFLGEIVRTKNQ